MSIPRLCSAGSFSGDVTGKGWVSTLGWTDLSGKTPSTTVSSVTYISIICISSVGPSRTTFIRETLNDLLTGGPFEVVLRRKNDLREMLFHEFLLDGPFHGR